MKTDSISAIFAYGTLKSGQCRQNCWPATPLSVEKGWTHGELYDTGPYPALFHGADRVAGEIWTFDENEFERVLHDLDEIEEYREGQTSTNLYNREIVECVTQADVLCRAYVYIYARQHDKRAFKRIVPSYVWGGQAFALWPAGGDW